ncbi:MAG: MaoC family dehydratase [Deltaproteobacteria bacterium]|nr:MaoC family dehydratase [Deltaproteobacteria bacterium]MBW2123925.1 MaoC family dehydratase [Deltaproteobacteria bacterium]
MEEKKGIDAVEIGLKEHFTKTVTETDTYLFAGLTGDFHGIHMDEEFAKKTRYGTRIVHGALLVGFVSTVMGKMNSHIPPPGGVSYRYDVKFVAPVMFGDTIRTELTVTEKIPERNEIVFEALSTNQDGKAVLKGKTVMKVLREP